LNFTASIAVDSIVDAISFINGLLFSDPKTSFSQIRLRLQPDLSSQIRLRTDFETNPVQPYFLPERLDQVVEYLQDFFTIGSATGYKKDSLGY